jgi:hypothetical protein
MNFTETPPLRVPVARKQAGSVEREKTTIGQTGLLVLIAGADTSINGMGRATVLEYHLQRDDGTLNKTELQFIEKNESRGILENWRETPTIRNKNYKPLKIKSYDVSFLFNRTPMINMVYEMLSDDLNRHHSIQFNLSIQTQW